MTGFQAAGKIDISAARTHHTKSDIDRLIQAARTYRFINVHVMPCWVSYLSEQLKNNPDILPGAPVGFPGGCHKTRVKILEAEELIRDGVGEMDMVMNIGKLKNREYDYVLDEIRSVKAVAGAVPLKIIIEISCLEDEEMLKACDLVIRGGADFIKSGTGWIGENANLSRLKKIKEYVGGSIKVKAAGGIRTIEEFRFLNDLGIERYGINMNTAVELVESLDAVRGES